ncbi:MAG: RimK family alpha-L-glutamate ligase [Sideroxydans sp.]|nr:RimK family alpha-L-glutamate ligase [Sideroxydans sp.]
MASPLPLQGLAVLMSKAFRGEDLTPLGNQLIEYAGSHPNATGANALLDLSIVLHLKGSHDVALSMQEEALKLQQCYQLPATGQPAIRLLAIMCPGDLAANTPLEFLVENSDIELSMLFISPRLPFPEFVPEHDVAFVAIGESSQSREILALATDLAKVWPRPLLNLPERIARLSRDSVSALLKSLPGVEIPAAVPVARQTLERLAHGELELAAVLTDGGFPVILRPRDSHAGKGLDKADNPAQIAAYLQGQEGTDFFVARFVDYRSADGQFRKYRVVLIDGLAYASHMAISDHWIVHYVSGGMLEQAEKRAEEERFMASFDEAFARRHASALAGIAERIGLDYLVIDCAETPEGWLLVFEVDNSAVVHAMDSVDMFPYKQPQMRKVFEAFRAMLFKAGARGLPHAAGGEL